MTVQAMFYVKEKREMTTGGRDPDRVVEVTLGAAFGTYLKGLPEAEANMAWSKYTPTGELKINITNSAVLD